MSGSPLALLLTKFGYLGGGKGGGGGGSLEFGIDIGSEELVGVYLELLLLDLLDDRYGSEGLEPYTRISGRSSDDRFAGG
jgi:hypothetical protein